jgi:hypothetical protein
VAVSSRELRTVLNSLKIKSKSKSVTLRLTDNQSVCLGVEPHLGLMTRYLLLFDNYDLFFWGAFSNERVGLSFVHAVTVFYCVRFETSLFVASYDSQGHGGGSRTRLATGTVLTLSQSHISTDGQSISKTECRATSGAHDQIFVTLWQLRSCFSGAPSLTRGWVCLLCMLLALGRVVFLGSDSLGTRDHNFLFQI